MLKVFSKKLNSHSGVLLILGFVIAGFTFLGNTTYPKYEVLEANVVDKFDSDLVISEGYGVEQGCYYSGVQVSALSKMYETVLVRNQPTLRDSDWIRNQSDDVKSQLSERVYTDGAFNRTIYRFEGVDSKGNLCFQAIYKYR